MGQRKGGRGSCKNRGQVPAKIRDGQGRAGVKKQGSIASVGLLWQCRTHLSNRPPDLLPQRGHLVLPLCVVAAVVRVGRHGPGRPRAAPLSAPVAMAVVPLRLPGLLGIFLRVPVGVAAPLSLSGQPAGGCVDARWGLRALLVDAAFTSLFLLPSSFNGDKGRAIIPTPTPITAMNNSSS